MSPSASQHAHQKGGGEDNRRPEHFVEGTVVRPKGLVVFLAFAGAVVGVLQTGQWLADVWNFFSHR